MKHLVVHAEHGGPGKSVHTAGGRPWRWWVEAVATLGLFTTSSYMGLMLLHRGLHLTGPAMWAAGTGVVAYCGGLTLWCRDLDRARARPVPVHAVDIDGAGDGQR
ncbi:hypothetical protein ACFV1W_25275 [Kitasatospora sp. NPDC059648]|uniref:hypothetical protein n=1 Tax=Kitasatospora sp. NPDC059648 TaxID=3346894 RepID=UPI0036C48613